MKLLLDEMLGRLSKWLRIFGIDTEYAGGRGDDELMDAARAGNRTLVTKDEPLAARCRKQNTSCVFLESAKLEEQLAELKAKLDLEFTFPEETRCPACNHPLKLVSRQEVRGLVHENVMKLHSKFWLCESCSKAYWEGSHWPNLTRIFETANKLAKKTKEFKP